MSTNQSGLLRKMDSIKILHSNAALPDSWTSLVNSAVNGLRMEGRPTNTWLLALDCLYHFSPSRKPIFSYASHVMKANLMAFDLMLNPEAQLLDRLRMKLLSVMMGCPLNAFITQEEYVKQLVESGFDEGSIHVRDVSSEVFPGLVGYLQRQRIALRQYDISLGKFWVAKKMFEWVDQTKVLRAVIITGKTLDNGKKKI